MKENKYDEQPFFERYSRMPRSVEGLSAAGEWRALQMLLPPLRGKRVLDLGCGFGWHCRHAAEQGARYVLGVDISEKMLEAARNTTPYPNVDYLRAAIEEFTVPPRSFDLVISSLALHYVSCFSEVCRNVAKALVPGGAFVFSVEHPIFTAQGPQDWQYGANGERLHWPVDNYFREGKRDAMFLGETVVKYHSTLTTYVNACIASGFTITGLSEPEPDPALLEAYPEMRDEWRRPMMLIIAAQCRGEIP